MNQFLRLAVVIDDYLNPIVVRDLRRAVRNKLIIGLLWLFLLISLLVLCWLGWLYPMTRGSSRIDGREVFSVLNAVMLAACTVGLPMYCGVMMAMERTQRSVDMLATTSLSARKVVTGKFLSGMVLVALIFSACAPFLSFTSLLRGIDLPTIFVILGFGLMTSVFCIQASLLVGALRMPIVPLAIVGVLAVGGLVWILCIAVMICEEEFIRRGVGSQLSSWSDFWWPAILTVGSVALSVGLTFELTVATIKPPNANRALPVRIYLTAAWLFSLVVFLAWSFLSEGIGTEAIFLWGLLWTALLTAVMLAAICERRELSPRIRRTIPRRWLLRIMVFPSYSGAASGITWAVGFLCLTNLTACLGIATFSSIDEYGPDLDDVFVVIILSIYGFCHVLTGNLIRRYLLGRWVAPAYGWIIPVVLAVVAMIAGALIYDLTRGNRSSICWILNPFLLFGTRDASAVDLSLAAACVWAAVVVALSIRPFLGQLRQFRPQAD